MTSGGEVVSRADKRLVVVLSDVDDRPDKMKPKKYKFVEPMRCKHPKKRAKSYMFEEVCGKCGESTTAELRKQLRAVHMSEAEIAQVSRLYLAYASYERSVDALVLPPFTDPIYRVPELPPSLREALKANDEQCPAALS